MILQKSFQYGAQETFYYYYIFVDAYIETDTFNKIQWKKKRLFEIKTFCNIDYCKLINWMHPCWTKLWIYFEKINFNWILIIIH